MKEQAQDSRDCSKGSGQSSNPAKKRRFVESNGSSSSEVEEGGVAPSQAAPRHRSESDQKQSYSTSESRIRPSSNGNCAPTAPEDLPSQRPVTSAVKRKQDSLEERKPTAHPPKRFNSTFNSPRANDGHERDAHLRGASSSHSQRQFVGQEHAESVARGITSGQNHDSSHDNSSRRMMVSSESMQVKHTSERPPTTDRDGKSKGESHHRNLVACGKSRHPNSSGTKMPPSQDTGDDHGSREAAMYSLNDQDAFGGRWDDSETASLRLQNATSLLHSLRNNQDRHLTNRNREEARPIPDSYYARAASVLAPALPTGNDEASRLIFAAAALRSYSGLLQPSSVAGAPLYSDVANQKVGQLVSNSIGASLREALQIQQHHRDIETERTRILARISQGHPWRPQSHAYDRPQEDIYRDNQLHSAVLDLRDGFPQLPTARYSAQLARQEEVDYGTNASRQQVNSLSALSNGESDALSNRQLLSAMSMSSALLLPPTRASITQNTRERYRGAEETVVPTRSPLVASVGRLLPSTQFLATEERGTGFVANNNFLGNQDRDQDSRWRPSTLQKANGAPPVPPPCVEGTLPPLSERTVLPLGIVQDKEFCSEFVSFVRSELVEVFRASGEDVAERISNKRIIWHQVGIRCRFCAHVPRMERVRRATTFPSSLARLHQSVSMMSREHFLECMDVPDDIKSTFKTLQENHNLSAPEKKSRTYWSEAANQLGLVDGVEGVMFHTGATFQGHQLLGTARATPGRLDLAYQALVENDDRKLVQNDYLYFLMSQAHRISLGEFDNRRNGQHLLQLGMAGFGCRHCSQMGVAALKGQNRIFPVKLRQLPAKANLLYEHLQHCELCPGDIKACISLLKSSEERRDKKSADQENEKKFFARIFVRLHGNVPTGVPVDCHERSESIDLEDHLENDGGDEGDLKVAARVSGLSEGGKTASV